MQLRQHKLLIYLLFFLGALFTFHISSADDLDSSPFQPEKYPEIMKECALDNILIGVPPESGTRYWETPTNQDAMCLSSKPQLDTLNYGAAKSAVWGLVWKALEIGRICLRTT